MATQCGLTVSGHIAWPYPASANPCGRMQQKTDLLLRVQLSKLLRPHASKQYCVESPRLTSEAYPAQGLEDQAVDSKT